MHNTVFQKKNIHLLWRDKLHHYLPLLKKFHDISSAICNINCCNNSWKNRACMHACFQFYYLRAWRVNDITKIAKSQWYNGVDSFSKNRLITDYATDYWLINKSILRLTQKKDNFFLLIIIQEKSFSFRLIYRIDFSL